MSGLTVAVSQRVDTFHDRQEQRDGLDQAWVKLLAGLGWIALPVPNLPSQVVAVLSRIKPDAIVLTGGNDIEPGNQDYSEERNATEKVLLRYAETQRLPLFGVCRGMQVLNVFLGGTLSVLNGHVRVDHLVHVANGYTRQVNSYHRFGITQRDLAPNLECVATATDGSVEAVQHRTLPWRGVMWHPERSSVDVSKQPALVAAALTMATDWQKN